MSDTIQRHAEQWQRATIEQCANDPNIIALGLCPTCMCVAPCLCDFEASVSEMRAYHDKHVRDQPKGNGNWGAKTDLFMETLFDIATKRHKEVLATLRVKL